MKRRFKGIFLGNKASILGIMVIIFMFFISQKAKPVDSRELSAKIIFNEQEYYYTETILASPFRFIRAKTGSDEGFRVLLMKKDKKEEPSKEIYIYKGKKQYYKYIIVIEE